MKAAIVATLLIAFHAAAQTEPDIRTVNGAKVDLTPLHAWYAAHEGDRPLKHWKRLQVLEPKDAVSTWNHVVCKTEDDSTADILVANLPASVMQFIDQTKELIRQIDEGNARIKELDEYIKQKQSSLSATGGPLGDSDFTSAKADIDSHKTSLQKAESDVESFQNQLRELATKHTDDLTIFAMFTGRKYTGLEIWDCGKVASRPSF